MSKMRFGFWMGKLSAVFKYRVGQEKAIESFYDWPVFVTSKYVNSCHTNVWEHLLLLL